MAVACAFQTFELFRHSGLSVFNKYAMLSTMLILP